MTQDTGTLYAASIAQTQTKQHSKSHHGVAPRRLSAKLINSSSNKHKAKANIHSSNNHVSDKSTAEVNEGNDKGHEEDDADIEQYDSNKDRDPIPEEELPEPSSSKTRRTSKKKVKAVPPVVSTFSAEDEFELKKAPPSLRLFESWTDSQRLNYECGISPDNPRREELVCELRREISDTVSAVKGPRLDKKNLDAYSTTDRFKLLATCEL